MVAAFFCLKCDIGNKKSLNLINIFCHCEPNLTGLSMISQLGGAMMNKLIVVFSAVVLIVGCTHTQENGFQFVREQYISKVQYNGIYHYGYNQGCESALAKRGVADQEYEKDQTLDGG